MLRERRAEVVGAGLSGLFVACALAQRGWKVRVHERGSDLRMFGAGIWLWENGLRSLEAIGALDDAIARGQRMAAWEIWDKHNRLIRRREAFPWDRLIVPPRADLYESLKMVAAREGVEIEVESRAVGADSSGEVEFADGSRARADLVIAADGIRSALRESLGQTSVPPPRQRCDPSTHPAPPGRDRRRRIGALEWKPRASLQPVHAGPRVPLFCRTSR